MIPKVIAEAQEYRKKVIADMGMEITNSDDLILEGEEGVLSLDPNQTSVKGRTKAAFLALYEKEGYDVFMKTANKLRSRGKELNNKEWGHFKGETAEMVLIVTIMEFIRKHNLPWKVFHSLVIPHYRGEEGATTECDVVLVSEEIVTVFEAKSNSGNKVLTDICTVNIKGREPNDIFKQNALHCNSLIRQIEHLNQQTQQGLMSVYFLFDDGKFTDKRTDSNKRKMPALDEKTLIQYLSVLTKKTTKNWKPEIYSFVEELSNKLNGEDHRNFIQGGK